MSTRRFALVFGILFVLIGLAGFVPALLSPPAGGPVDPNTHHELLLGMFPVNPLHNIVHILFGAWGLAASRSSVRSRFYARGVAIAYLALTLMGFVPGLDDLFGLVPLYGNDIWLHFFLALIAAYFGWVNRSPVPDAPAM